MEVNGKVALVTGGAARIGKAISLSLANDGYKVALHYGNSAGEAKETVEQIKSKGGDASEFKADFTGDLESIRGLINEVTDHFGQIDVLVNNAGVFLEGGFEDEDLHTWETNINVNLRAPFFLSQAFTKQIGSREGQIVNITDWHAERPNGQNVAYTISKAGLISLTQSLALTLAPNIKVNALALGAILSPAGKGDDFMQELASSIPLKKTSSVDEVTEAIRFILSSNFITGDIINLTGGAHLGKILEYQGKTP